MIAECATAAFSRASVAKVSLLIRALNEAGAMPPDFVLDYQHAPFEFDEIRMGSLGGDSTPSRNQEWQVLASCVAKASRCHWPIVYGLGGKV